MTINSIINNKETNNKLPKIILLSGYKRCGKDTLANYLQNNYGYNHVKISQKLNDCIKLLFNLEEKNFEENKEEIIPNWGTSTRKLMQFIGTDIFQYKIQEIIPDTGRDLWINTLFNDELIDKLVNNDNYRIVISDLRFLHEYHKIEKLNIPFIHIRIINPNIEYKDTHISENELYKIRYNYNIINDKCIELFYNKINNLINSL